MASSSLSLLASPSAPCKLIDRAWNEKYQMYIHRKKNEKLNLANHGSSSSQHDRSIRDWAYKQRRCYQEGTLPGNRQALLDAIDFDYTIRGKGVSRRKNVATVGLWETRYQELLAYHTQHGHCRIPYNAATTKGTPLHTLSHWCTTQRTRRSAVLRGSNRGVRPLTADEIAKLDAIGFVWTLSSKVEERWNEMFRSLKAYKMEHGDCNVSRMDEKNKLLSNFSIVQRRNYRENKIRPDRQAKLEEIGFKWQLRTTWDPNRDSTVKDKKWEAKYTALCQFQELHGHCMVAMGSDLGGWVNINRQKFKEGKLSEDRVDSLNAINFVWKVDHTDPNCSLKAQEWESMFERLLAFRDVYGHSNPLRNECEDQKLVTWTINQRSMCAVGNLEPKRKTKLDEVGFLWNSLLEIKRMRAQAEETSTKSSSERAHLTADNDASPRCTEVPPRKLLVGDRISVYWTDDDEYYPGSVVRRGDFSGRFRIHYDDGDKEWLDFQENKPPRIKWLGTEESEKVQEKKRCRTTDNEAKPHRTEAPPCKLSVGDRISVYWTDDEEYYPGTVVRRGDLSGRFRVHYDDGDKEWLDFQDDRPPRIKSLDAEESEKVQEKKRCRMADTEATPHGTETPSHKLSVGDRISIYWTDDDEYYPGTVVRRGDLSGRFRVHYDDGDKEWLDFHEDKPPRIKWLDNEESKKSDEKKRCRTTDNEANPQQPGTLRRKLSVGDRISVYWSGDDEYYPGMVLRQDGPSGRFRIHYDDGDRRWLDFQATRPPKIKWLDKEESKKGHEKKICTTMDNEANPHQTETLPRRLSVGDRISVYWPDDDEYYPCTAVRQDDPSGRFRIHYDDGDKQWLDFQDARPPQIKWLDTVESKIIQQKKREIAAFGEGTRLSVWWPVDKAYYIATVTKIKYSRNKPFYVEYEDGSGEWLNLLSRKYEVV